MTSGVGYLHRLIADFGWSSFKVRKIVEKDNQMCWRDTKWNKEMRKRETEIYGERDMYTEKHYRQRER